MMIILKILDSLIVIFATILTVKALLGEPMNIFGCELNQHKVKHDTLKLYVHDTIYMTKSNHNENVKTTQAAKINVTSKNQKGGQTANQIYNNN